MLKRFLLILCLLIPATVTTAEDFKVQMGPSATVSLLAQRGDLLPELLGRQAVGLDAADQREGEGDVTAGGNGGFDGPCFTSLDFFIFFASIAVRSSSTWVAN